MVFFSKGFAGPCALVLTAILTSSQVSATVACKPPKILYAGPFGGACVTPINALSPELPEARGIPESVPEKSPIPEGAAPSDNIKVTPKPGGAVTTESIYERLGKPSNAKITTDASGQKSLEFENVPHSSLPDILQTIGIPKEQVK